MRKLTKGQVIATVVVVAVGIFYVVFSLLQSYTATDNAPVILVALVTIPVIAASVLLLVMMTLVAAGIVCCFCDTFETIRQKIKKSKPSPSLSVQL